MCSIKMGQQYLNELAAQAGIQNQYRCCSNRSMNNRRERTRGIIVLLELA